MRSDPSLLKSDDRPGQKPVFTRQTIESLDDLHKAIALVLAERGEIQIIDDHGRVGSHD